MERNPGLLGKQVTGTCSDSFAMLPLPRKDEDIGTKHSEMRHVQHVNLGRKNSQHSPSLVFLYFHI